MSDFKKINSLRNMFYSIEKENRKKSKNFSYAENYLDIKRELKSVLKENNEINFFSLFDANYSKLEVITVFLAILELLKFQYAEVVQKDKYEDILIKAKEKINEEMAS